MKRENLEKFYDEIYPTAGVFAPWIGTTGGTALTLGEARPVAGRRARSRPRGLVPDFMAGEVID